jgi:hypothetical protein
MEKHVKAHQWPIVKRVYGEDAPQRVNMVRDCVLDARAISGRIIPGLVSIALGTPALV